MAERPNAYMDLIRQLYGASNYDTLDEYNALGYPFLGNPEEDFMELLFEDKGYGWPPTIRQDIGGGSAGEPQYFLPGALERFPEAIETLREYGDPMFDEAANMTGMPYTPIERGFASIVDTIEEDNRRGRLGRGRPDLPGQSYRDVIASRRPEEQVEPEPSFYENYLNEFLKDTTDELDPNYVESAENLRPTPWEDLMRFGLATAAGDSPFFFSNVAQGGLYALEQRTQDFRDYQTALSDIEINRASAQANRNALRAAQAEVAYNMMGAEGGDGAMSEAAIESMQLLFENEIKALLAEGAVYGEDRYWSDLSRAEQQQIIARVMENYPFLAPYVDFFTIPWMGDVSDTEEQEAVEQEVPDYARAIIDIGRNFRGR